VCRRLTELSWLLAAVKNETFGAGLPQVQSVIAAAAIAQSRLAAMRLLLNAIRNVPSKEVAIDRINRGLRQQFG